MKHDQQGWRYKQLVRQMMQPEVSYITLGEDAPRRLPPRKACDMQANYLALYDEATLFSDVFFNGSSIELNCPPPLNLRKAVEVLNYYIDGVKVRGGGSIRDLERASYVTLPIQARGGEDISIRGNLGRYSSKVQPAEHWRFRDKHVLVTHQRDNDLAWIAYWVHHHVTLYGFNSVLLYDNMSRTYSTEELVETLSRIPGVDSFAVVSWPTPFGPLGHNKMWDSDFGQHIYLRNSYSRFLRLAASALVCDIDELLVAADESLNWPDLVHASRFPVVSFKRRQVPQVLLPEAVSRPDHTHASYGFIEAGDQYISRKYGYNPNKLAEYPDHVLQVHIPRKVPRTNIDPEVAHIRHFGGIRILWRSGSLEKQPAADDWNGELIRDPSLARDIERLAPSWRTFYEAVLAN